MQHRKEEFGDGVDSSCLFCQTYAMFPCVTHYSTLALKREYMISSEAEPQEIYKL